MKVVDPDQQFFIDHPDREAHIRPPKRELGINPQRAVRYADECEGEFWSLGEHDHKRRRIILWKVPSDRWHMIPDHDGKTQPIMKIPFLAFADETIEDRDDILLPILHEIMTQKAV